VHLTGGILRHFRVFSTPEQNPALEVLSTPAHPPVTQTVGRLPCSTNSVRDNLITVRRIQVGEIDLYKQIRLASLQDAPYAFETSYDSAVRRSNEIWQERAASGAQGTDGATFFAFSNELPIGIAALFRVKSQTDLGELMQVWVSPDYRGTNVAWDLMNVIFKWAEENNFRRIIAGVTKVNSRALSFYIKYGFSIMDESAQHDPNSVYLEKEVKG